MFAIVYSITPNLWLASLIFAATAPPVLAAWGHNRWRFSLRMMLVVTVVFCAGLFFIGQDVWHGPSDPLVLHYRLVKHRPGWWLKWFFLPSVCLLVVSTTITVSTQKWLNRRKR